MSQLNAREAFRQISKSKRLDLHTYTTQTLKQLSWRELGRLLVYLDTTIADRQPHWITSVSYLAATIVHMQTDHQDTVSPVDGTFVGQLFATMTLAIHQICVFHSRSTTSSVLYHTMKCLSSVLVADANGRFSMDAVLLGCLSPMVALDRASKQLEYTDSTLVDVLVWILEDGSSLDAQRHALRALRARQNTLLNKIQQQHDGRLVGALAGCTLENWDSGTSDVFACLRDLLPVNEKDDRVDVRGSVDALSKLCNQLTDMFRLEVDNSILYQTCKDNRLRCYQWTTMCRISTYLSSHTKEDMVWREASRLCWMQLNHPMPVESLVSVWLLCVSESLNHLSQLKESTSQPRVFQTLTMLLATLSKFGDFNTTVTFSSICSTCNRLLRLMDREAITMGLFEPDHIRQPVKDNIFEDTSTPSVEDEVEREAKEEVVRESRIAQMFVALDKEANQTATPNIPFLTTLLQWMQLYTRNSRDSVGRQTRVLERTKPVNIRVVGLKVQRHKSATDWSRLQRLPLVRLPPATDICKPSVVGALQALILLHHRKGDFWLRHSINEKEAKRLSSLAWQTLASILGVRSHLATSNIDKLQLPHLYIRDRSPRSSEALMDTAMQAGICERLLDPKLLAYYLEKTHDGGALARDKVAFRELQLWLDMVGNVVRHSLFRKYLSSSGSFVKWWSIAVVYSSNQLVEMLNQRDFDQIRVASVIPSHLLSWHKHLLPLKDIGARIDPSIREYWQPILDSEFSNQRSLDSLIYYMACQMWLDVRAFDAAPADFTDKMLRVCRDVWGIATESLQLFNTQYASYFDDHHKLAKRYSTSVLVPLLGNTDKAPTLIRYLLNSKHKLEFYPHPHFDETTDLITLPQIDESLIRDTEPSDSLSDTYVDEDKGDPVDRLLYQSAQQMSRDANANKPTSVAELYSESVLAQLWSTYTQGLLKLPANLVFRQAQDNQTEWLLDRQDIWKAMFEPLLVLGFGLARLSESSNVLWESIYQTIPIETAMAIVTAMADKQNIGDASHEELVRICAMVALIMPKLDGQQQQQQFKSAIGTILRILVGELLGGQLGERCQKALDFWKYRQLDYLMEQIQTCSDNLRTAAIQIYGQIDCHGGDHEQIMLCSSLQPAAPENKMCKALLMEQSKVIETMMSGNFKETATTSNNHQLSLEWGCLLLNRLAATLEACHSTESFVKLEASLHKQQEAYSWGDLCDLFELSVHYDIQFVVVWIGYCLAQKIVDDGFPTRFCSKNVLCTVYNCGRIASFGLSAEAIGEIRKLLSLILFTCVDDMNSGGLFDMDNVDIFVKDIWQI